MDPIFGLGRIHHVFSAAQRERIVLSALDAGFSHFDVAAAYGDGMAERELGRVLGGRRASIRITTKFGIPMRAIGELPTPLYFALRGAGQLLSTSFGARYDRRDFSPRVLIASVEASLRRLRTDYIDYLLVHEPATMDQFRALPGTWDELARLQSQGKVRRFGVSGDTQLLLDAENQGFVPSAAVRMVPMNDRTCELPEDWFIGKEVFVFNIVKHLGRTMGPGRIETRLLIDAVARALPRCRPVLASNNPAEIRRMGQALAAARGAAAVAGAAR
jgi:hypothetical protein